MKSSLLDLTKNIDGLLKSISGTEKIEKVLSSKISKPPLRTAEKEIFEFKSNFDIKTDRQFSYISNVIFLYATFESFIESSIVEYISLVAKHTQQPQDLNEAILNTHKEVSYQLIGKTNHQKYRGRISEDNIVRNLFLINSNDEGYSLTTEAFTHHDANFRREQINSNFSRVGVPHINERILKHPYFLKLMSDWENSNNSTIEYDSIISELAERRNEVGHGMPDEIVSGRIIASWAEFIRNYCRTLSHLLYEEYIMQYVDLVRLPNFGNPIHIYRNKICCFNLVYSNIAVGDYLVICRNDGNIRISIIESLQHNNTPIPNIQADPTEAICVECKYPVRETDQILLIEQSRLE